MPEDKNKSADSGAGDGSEDGDESKGKAGAESESQGEPKKLEFTQEELDAVIVTRAKRMQPKDYDALKAKAEKYDAAEAASLSESEKATAKAAADAAATAARNAALDAREKRLAIIEEATAQKVTSPKIVAALLKDSADITVNEDGEVEGVADAIKALLKSEPSLKGAGKAPTSGGEFGGNDQKTLKERINELESAGKIKEARALKIEMGLAASQ